MKEKTFKQAVDEAKDHCRAWWIALSPPEKLPTEWEFKHPVSGIITWGMDPPIPDQLNPVVVIEQFGDYNTCRIDVRGREW